MAFNPPTSAFPGGKPPSIGKPPGSNPGNPPSIGKPPTPSSPPGGAPSSPPGGAAPGNVAPWQPPKSFPPPTSPTMPKPPGAGLGKIKPSGGGFAGAGAAIAFDLFFPEDLSDPVPPSSNVPEFFNPGGSPGSPEGYNLLPPSAPYSFDIHASFTRNHYNNNEPIGDVNNRPTAFTSNLATSSVEGFGVPVAIVFKRIDLGFSTFGGFDGKKYVYMAYRHQIDLAWKTPTGEDRLTRMYTGDGQGFTHFDDNYQYFDNGQPLTFSPPEIPIPDQFPDGYSPSAPPLLAPPFADPEIQKLPTPQFQPAAPLRRNPVPPFAPAPVVNPGSPPTRQPSPPPTRQPSPPPLRLPNAPGQPLAPTSPQRFPPALPQTPKLPQPQPALPPPKPPTTTGTGTPTPPKPPTPEICQDPCIADIQRALEDLADSLESSECPPLPTSKISIKIFRACIADSSSDSEVAEFDTIQIDVPQSEAANIKELHDRIFELQEEACRKPRPECVAAVPEWWQVRLGADRPQLIVQYAELLTATGATPPKYGAPNQIITIPHYRLNADQTNRNLFPPYQKGQAMGILTLSDNSKLIVNCIAQRTSQLVIEQLQNTINSELLEGSQLSIGTRKGQALKTITVYPRIVKYFANGQADLKPTWIKYFKDPDLRDPINTLGCAI